MYFVYENKGKLPTVKDLYGTKIIHHGVSTKKNNRTRKKRGGQVLTKEQKVPSEQKGGRKRSTKKKTRKKRGGDGEHGRTCAICHDRPANHQFCRNHYFCLECTTQWLSTVHNNMAGCPLCRAPYGRGYGHWWQKELELDVPAEVGSLMYKKVFGPCCSDCEKTCWDKLTCSRPKCYPCITDGLMIVGKEEKKIQCKKRTRGGRRKKKTRKKRGGLGIPLDPNTTNEYLYTNPHNGEVFQVSVQCILGDEDCPLEVFFPALPPVLIINNEERDAVIGDALVAFDEIEFAVPQNTLTPIEQGGRRRKKKGGRKKRTRRKKKR